jgi:biotin carboxyl carrier protein
MIQEKELKKLVIDDTNYFTNFTVKYQKKKPYIPLDTKKITAVIPGMIQEIFVKKGQAVKKNEDLVILEAMKMRNVLTSPIEGVIKRVHVNTGTMVTKGALLLEFE